MSAKRRHPNDHDLYTPITPEVLALLRRMRDEHGTWRRVAAITETRLKVLRNVRQVRRSAISLTLMDRLTTGTGVGSVSEFIWFKAEDLVNLGIWKPIVYIDEDET